MIQAPDPLESWTLEEMKRCRGESCGPLDLPTGAPAFKIEDVGPACGTRRKYEQFGCRCQECKAENRRRKAAYQ